MFDVLKDDFDYWFILGTLGILVLVTIVSQRLASIKMLRQAWQWEETPPNYSLHCFMFEALIPAHSCTFEGWGENWSFNKHKYHKISGNIQFTWWLIIHRFPVCWRVVNTLIKLFGRTFLRIGVSKKKNKFSKLKSPKLNYHLPLNVFSKWWWLVQYKISYHKVTSLSLDHSWRCFRRQKNFAQHHLSLSSHEYY